MPASPAQKQNAKMKREHFCLEYVSNGYNATEAYRVAFNCDSPNAYKLAYRLMQEPEVHKRIEDLIHQKYLALHINADRLAEKLATMAFAEPDDEFYGPQAQLKAIDLLQKQLGLQKQNIKADVETTQTINVTIEEE